MNQRTKVQSATTRTSDVIFRWIHRGNKSWLAPLPVDELGVHKTRVKSKRKD